MTTAPEFDPDRALRLSRRLAFPRAVGSPGERLAARLVERALARAGRPAVRERFPVGVEARRYGSLLAVLGAAALVVVGLVMVMARIRPGLAPAPFLAASWLVNAPWMVTRSLANRWRSRVWSENLVSWPIEHEEPAPSRVVLVAHYDSKSQRLPTGVRVAMVLSATSGGLALATMAAVEAIAPDLIGPSPMAAAGGMVLLALAALMVNASGNRSPGALDNASGLAVLLELARVLPPLGEEGVDVAFVASGAEEVGLDGARAFLQRHEWWLRERPSLLINLDSVGAGDRVRLAGEASAVAMAERVADSIAVPTERFRILGAGMDHEPFAAAGLPALTLLGDVVGHSSAMHSSRDLPELVDREAMGRAGLLAIRLILAWADRYRPVAEGASIAESGGRSPGPSR
ncbi:M28 family metallopeptidase [Tautonia sociabilis]|nr:M28 family peptidase [Tautonia sociabilis]